MSFSAGPPGPPVGPGRGVPGFGGYGVGGPPRARARRSKPAFFTLIALLFVVMPLAELALIIAIGRVIGGWETIGLLLLESAIGAWLVRREGATAWRGLQVALQTGRMPARELSDAALVLIGGVLLLTPGFLTDVFGFFLLLPFTRPIARRWLQVIVERQLALKVGLIRGQVR